ncbi:MAG: BON domain-containing protein [Halofilum sp. (in: g-proteobacteria)]
MANTVQQVRAALEQDRDINLHEHPIEIRVDDAIRLVGEVGDIRAKRKAWRLARAATARDDVIDELSIVPGEPRGADELRQAVLDTLKQEPVFAEVSVVDSREPPGNPVGRGWIGVDTEGARVVLVGEIGGLSQRRLAEVLCWWVPGSADVDNRIHVDPPEPDTDTALSSAIAIVLERDPSVDGDQVGVTARHAVVRLEGVVPTAEQARLAELDCWYVPGVHDVDHQLIVQSAP